MKKRMGSELENPFDRLPTDLILYILEKISDVENLCLCYPVSKLFASLVPRTRFVSLQIASVMGSSDVVALAESSDVAAEVWPPGSLNFMKKLSCVQHATIQFYPSMARSYSGPLVRWKSDSSGFILVAAENRVDHCSAGEPTDRFMTPEYYLAILDSIRNHLYHLRMRGVVIKELLRVFPSLKKVSAVESTEQGSFVWEEDIDSMKRERSRSDVFSVKLWSEPSVELPISGCTMKDVAMVSIREMKNAHGFMEENPFEEPEYHELAMITMKQFHTTFEHTLEMAPYILDFLQFRRLLE